MGLMFSLHCTGCGYQSRQLLTGWGMVARMEVHHCLDCQELVSVVMEVEQSAPSELLRKQPEQFQRCPHCGGYSLVFVSALYACPKCGTRLVEGEEEGGIWD